MVRRWMKLQDPSWADSHPAPRRAGRTRGVPVAEIGKATIIISLPAILPIFVLVGGGRMNCANDGQHYCEKN
jgi:hypothetical protein